MSSKSARNLKKALIDSVQLKQQDSAETAPVKKTGSEVTATLMRQKFYKKDKSEQSEPV